MELRIYFRRHSKTLYKKHLKNNLCLYYSAGDHKLDFCLKKQTIVTLKGCGTSTTANPLVATSKKPLEK